MRILLTADPELQVPPRLYGGIERIVDALVRGLRSRGHDVGLVARAGSTCPADAFFPWPGERSQNRTDSVRNAFALAGAAKSFRPDVLHSFSRIAYMTPLLRARLPKIMSYQRRPGPRNTARAMRLARRGTMRFTGCSEHICRQGREGGGEWTVIPNFVELEKFAFQDAVPKDAPLVFLSRIERIKGAHNAIAAARQAGVPLVLAGNRVEEGEGPRYWKEEIEPHIDGGRVRHVGPVDDAGKSELLGSARAMIVPIEWDEPFGIVFAESLACGTPVISSPRGSLPEIVEEGIHGFLVRSPEETVSAIGRLSEIDRSACRARAESHFAGSVVIPRYVSLYERAIAEAGKRR